MTTGRKYDVIVVGAGNAALTAALSAHQRGAKVLVLEKAPEAEKGGNSRFSGGLFRFAYEGIEDLKPLRPDVSQAEWDRVEAGNYDPSAYMADIMRVTQGEANKELCDVLTKESLSTVMWMTDLGVRWEWTFLWSQTGGERIRFTPGSVLGARNKGVGLMEHLFAATEQAGIEIVYQSKMIGFMQDDIGRVLGVRVRTPSGVEDVAAGAVVLASGGFEANTEMRAMYLGQGWDRVKVRGTRFNTGETLRMALDIGAMPAGHWQGCHATPIDANAAPVGELHMTDLTNRLSYPFSIMVNKEGRRFADEGEDTGGYTYAKMGRMIMNEPGGVAYQIFDQKTLHLLEERYETGVPVTADTIPELESNLGLPSETLVETVRDFNAACRPGEFDPGVKDGVRTHGLPLPKSNWALPIDTPPYVVYPASCGITFTFGGVKIDTGARVISTEGEPIPGLYATGEITGDFFYHNYPGGTGLVRGAVFGRIGGDNAAREALRQ